MDNRCIYVPLNLFSFKQPIYLVEEDQTNTLIEKVETSQLATKIYAFCKECHTDCVKLIGENEYLLGVKEQILTLEKSEYSKNIIKVEVN